MGMGGGTLATGEELLIWCIFSHLSVISFLIGGDGNIYEGRGWNIQGAHTGGFNTEGYGVCFLGNFMDHNPNEAAITAYHNLARCMVEEEKISK